MKLMLRIFNIVIMALAALATVFMFITPTMSFNSNIGLDVKALSKFVPETQYTQDVDIVKLVGADTIHLGLKFSLDYKQAKELMHGDRAKINEYIVTENVDSITSTLHTPVDLITDFTIRTVLKSTIKSEITKQVQASAQAYGGSSTAEDIMDEVGMDDTYFTNFAFALYDAADSESANVDSVSEVLFEQIDDALAMAEDSQSVDVSTYGDDAKAQVKENLLTILDTLKLVGDGGKIKRVSQISYIYLAEYLKKTLDGKVPASDLEQKTDETNVAYSDRLVRLFVETQTPDMVYKAVGWSCIALVVGIYVFAGIWALLFLVTLLKTFSPNKPWTHFWFLWAFGWLQLVLGIGITVAGKFILPSYSISGLGLPISSMVLVPRTFALIPSIIYGACVVLAIIYCFFKIPVKHGAK